MGERRATTSSQYGVIKRDNAPAFFARDSARIRARSAGNKSFGVHEGATRSPVVLWHPFPPREPNEPNAAEEKSGICCGLRGARSHLPRYSPPRAPAYNERLTTLSSNRVSACPLSAAVSRGKTGG